MRTPRPRTLRPRGFTLLEALLAILILMVIAAFSAAAVAPLVARSRLDGSLEALGTALDRARTLAVTEAALIHVRLEPGRDGEPAWVGVYRFGEERVSDDGEPLVRVRRFEQEGAAVPDGWPAWGAPEEIPWSDARSTLLYRAELDGAIRFCSHGRGPCDGVESAALPRLEAPGGATGEYCTLYFLPDGSASGTFLIVLRSNDDRAGAVRLEELTGRTSSVVRLEEAAP